MTLMVMTILVMTIMMMQASFRWIRKAADSHRDSEAELRRVGVALVVAGKRTGLRGDDDLSLALK